jgi:threonine dehydratase
VALAAKKLGCDAVIAMPVTTPQIKVDAVRALGATVGPPHAWHPVHT